MPPVERLGDHSELVSTTEYPSYAKFPFEKFNPVQSTIFQIFREPCNAIIAAATSAGKTICAELFMSHEVRERGGKAMYLGPLRALAKEKIDDWTDKSHHFGDLNLSICTGDFRLTADRKKELENSNVVVMTSEMLNSRCRNFKSESNEWLKDVGTLVVDESHLLTVPGRGDHLEVGLMKFCEINPDCRIIFLSATMPNVEEIAEWVSYALTGRKTYLIESTYRPCPLGIHYEEYEEAFSYESTEEEKINQALRIVDEYPEDKFLVFVHTKNTGQMMKRSLEAKGVECEFHNADLEKGKRHEVEHKFRSGNLRAIVATSTLAWGLNMPARRVIITGVHRGVTEVATYDIFQMAGRAGRPGYDPRGDVYVLLPKNKFDYHMSRLSKPQRIESQLLEYVGDEQNPHYKTLAFHLVSEIHHGQCKNADDIYRWFERSLASFQSGALSDDILERTINLLLKVYAIKLEEGEYSVTSIGKIASMFYYSPFDVADLRRNFKFLFEHGLEGNDLALSMSLGNVDSIRCNFVSRAEREEMSAFANKVSQIMGTNYTESAVKGAYAHFVALNAMSPGPFTAMVRGLQQDFPRTTAVLEALDSMSGKWEKGKFFKQLQTRMVYGVKDYLVELCSLPDIGKVRAERLHAAGIRTINDIAAQPDRAKRILNLKDDKANNIINIAKGLALTSS